MMQQTTKKKKNATCSVSRTLVTPRAALVPWVAMERHAAAAAPLQR
jgi:hypothetical protein